ncbi:MAG: DUF2067 family protein [Candidatus Korarchaeum sp.]
MLRRGYEAKRSLVLSIDPSELSDFLEYLEKRMEGRNYSCKYSTSSGLKITIFGNKEELRDSEAIVRRSYRNFKIVRNPMGNLYRYPSEWLTEHGGVSMSLLTLSLEAAGLTADWRGDLLLTELDPDEIIDLMSELKSLLEEIKYEVRQRRAREVLVAVAVSSGASPIDVLELAEEEGFLRRDEEGTWYFKVDPELAMRELRRKLTGGD